MDGKWEEEIANVSKGDYEIQGLARELMFSEGAEPTVMLSKNQSPWSSAEGHTLCQQNVPDSIISISN